MTGVPLPPQELRRSELELQVERLWNQPPPPLPLTPPPGSAQLTEFSPPHLQGLITQLGEAAMTGLASVPFSLLFLATEKQVIFVCPVWV